MVSLSYTEVNDEVDSLKPIYQHIYHKSLPILYVDDLRSHYNYAKVILDADSLKPHSLVMIKWVIVCGGVQ